MINIKQNAKWTLLSYNRKMPYTWHDRSPLFPSKMCSLLYFIVYSYCSYSCPQFFPFVPFRPVSPTPQAISTLLYMPWVLHMYSLRCTWFPIMYLTSTWLFCNYQLVLNAFTLYTYSPELPPSDNHQNVLFIYGSVSVLLVCLFCFLDSIVDRYILILLLLLIFFNFFSSRRPFNISYSTGLVVMDIFSFFFSEKLFICPLILNDSFSGYSNLGCRSLLFIFEYFLTIPCSLQSFFWEIKWESCGGSFVTK